MQFKQLATLGAITIFLSACGGGDININADSVDNSVDNSVGDTITGDTGGGTEIVCASYVDGGGVNREGQVDGDNCFYSEAFVDFDNPLLSSITLSNIGDGAHIFAGSLFLGQNYDVLADANAAGLNAGGDGPTLTVRPGVTVALQNSEDFIAIMRGSRIEAVGNASQPITFTSEDDVNGLVTAEETQTWGGMVIMGFGFTNECLYDIDADASGDWTQADPDAVPLVLEAGTECSIQVEGTEGDFESHYGGTVHDDNSGTLSYVVVKHAGFEIGSAGSGNELNGITFGAVGSGTTLNNLEIYSNKDDGIEFFGGSADLTNYVAMYVQDDSIDLDAGYFGTITNALVIQGGGTGDNSEKSGQHCVESDGSTSANRAFNDAQRLLTRATISNLTCILGGKGPGFSGQGSPSAGINAEEEHLLTLTDSIVTMAYAIEDIVDSSGVAVANPDFSNYCFQLEDTDDLVNAGNGEISITNSIFACDDISSNKDQDSDITLTAGSVHGAISGTQFLIDEGNVVFDTGAADGSVRPDGDGSLAGQMTILDGYYSVPVADMLIDTAAVTITGTTIGAVSASDDWTSGWTFGLQEGNRAQALWFE